MNKFSKAAVLVAGLALGANAAGLVGVGWDDGLGEITARLGLGANYLDVGLGLSVDPENNNEDARFLMSASGIFLGHLHDWGPVDTYFAAGGIFEKAGTPNDNIHISALVGFQPEVTLLDHIVVSNRFGLSIPLSPDFQLQTGGQAISIVQGLNFKILF